MKPRLGWLLRLACVLPVSGLTVLWVDGALETHGGALTDRMLESFVAFGLPLLAWAVFSGFPPESSTAEEVALLRYGQDQQGPFLRRLALRSLVFVAVAAALVAFAVTTGRGSADPRLGADLLASLTAMALSGFALAGWLALAGLWGGRFGIWLALTVVWTLGHLPFAIAATTPLGNLRYLLGLGPVLPFATWIASLLLAFMTFASAALLWARAPR